MIRRVVLVEGAECSSSTIAFHGQGAPMARAGACRGSSRGTGGESRSPRGPSRLWRWRGRRGPRLQLEADSTSRACPPGYTRILEDVATRRGSVPSRRVRRPRRGAVLPTSPRLRSASTCRSRRAITVQTSPSPPRRDVAQASTGRRSSVALDPSLRSGRSRPADLPGDHHARISSCPRRSVAWRREDAPTGNSVRAGPSCTCTALCRPHRPRRRRAWPWRRHACRATGSSPRARNVSIRATSTSWRGPPAAACRRELGQRLADWPSAASVLGAGLAGWAIPTAWRPSRCVRRQHLHCLHDPGRLA